MIFLPTDKISINHWQLRAQPNDAENRDTNEVLSNDQIDPSDL
jgi:hypothetical protein